MQLRTEAVTKPLYSWRTAGPAPCANSCLSTAAADRPSAWQRTCASGPPPPPKSYQKRASVVAVRVAGIGTDARMQRAASGCAHLDRLCWVANAHLGNLAHGTTDGLHDGSGHAASAHAGRGQACWRGPRVGGPWAPGTLRQPHPLGQPRILLRRLLGVRARVGDAAARKDSRQQVRCPNVHGMGGDPPERTEQSAHLPTVAAAVTATAPLTCWLAANARMVPTPACMLVGNRMSQPQKRWVLITEWVHD